MGEVFIGIDFGGSNTKAGLFDKDINLLGKDSIPTDADAGPADVVKRIASQCAGLIDKSGFSSGDIAAIGIGTPGPADYPNGLIIRSANMPTFKKTPLRDMIAAELGAPAVLENDANVACWGEFTEGVGKDISDMVFFTLGTGIGGGIVTEGRLLTGSDYNAAELGHIIIHPDGRLCGCGQKGCVEAYASASSTAARAIEALAQGGKSSLQDILDQNCTVTCKAVFAHAESGDPLAGEIVDGTAKALAIMCINMLHTTEPKRIVFSGGMIAAGDFLLNKIKKHFDDQIWTLKPERLEICFATLGEDTGIIGAASLAKYTKQTGKF
jgi:glucokinase